MQIIRLLMFFFCIRPLQAHQWASISRFDWSHLGMYTALTSKGLHIAVYYNKHENVYFGNKASQENFSQGRFKDISPEKAEVLFICLESCYQREKKEREDYLQRHFLN